MWNWKILFLLYISLPVFLHAQQFISGEISRNTQWEGKIYINGDIIIPKGVVLSIKAGSQILVQPNMDREKSGKDPDLIEIIVLGKLIARGDGIKGKIRFTVNSPNPRMNQWYGIEFKNLYENSILDNVIVEYGYKGITCYGSSPLIQNSEISYNYFSGISAEVRARPIIKNNVISGNEFAGINCELASYPLIEGNLITENENGIVIFDRSQPDLGHAKKGTDWSKGLNRIYNNFEYNVYNHSGMDIYAQNNIWNTNNIFEIRLSVFDRDDDPTYGKVIFLPIYGQSIKIKRPAKVPPLSESKVPKTEKENKPLSQDSANITTADSIQRIIQDSLRKKYAIPDVPVSTPPLAKPETVFIYQKPPPESASKTIEPRVKEPIIEALLDGGKRYYIRKVKPRYPLAYRQNGIEGSVFIEVIVDKAGNIKDYRVLKSDGKRFTEVSIEALKKFKYRPGTFRGKPVSFKVVERFVFRLEK